MSGEPVHGNHANPPVYPVERSAAVASEQILAQGANLSERVGMIEDLELSRVRDSKRQINRREPALDFLGGGWR